jgi:hypothetical protein
MPFAEERHDSHLRTGIRRFDPPSGGPGALPLAQEQSQRNGLDARKESVMSGLPNSLLRLGSRVARPFVIGPAAFLLLTAAGCGFESGDSTRSSTWSSQIGGPVAQSDDYAELIGPAGGSLGGSDAWFVVPANALSTETTITMSVSPAGSPGSLLEADMGPNGQNFAVACTLSISKPAGYNQNDVYCIALWDETNSEWDDLGGTDHGSYVSLEVSHFSKYKIVINHGE